MGNYALSSIDPGKRQECDSVIDAPDGTGLATLRDLKHGNSSEPLLKKYAKFQARREGTRTT
jgi:hypothetical protein